MLSGCGESGGPASETGTGSQGRDSQYDLGLELQRSGKPAEAIPHFTAYLESHPRSADTLDNLGVCAQALGHAEDAASWFEKAIAAEPGFTEARVHLAALWIGTPRNDDAVRLLLEVLRADPRHDRALSLLLGKTSAPADSSRHRKLASLLGRQRLPAAAVEALRRGIHAAPEDWRTHIALAWILATCPEKAVRDPVEAVRLAEPLVRSVAASDPTALDTLAAAYASLGRFEEALRTVDRALALPPGEKAPQAIEQRRKLYQERKPFLEGE